MSDLLPPMPGEEPNEPNQDDLQSEETDQLSELDILLAGLPIEAEASASTDSPQELIASSATPASTSSTAPAA